MAKIAVKFRYLTGLKRQIFTNARLSGSWDSQGKFSATWTQTPMTRWPGRRRLPVLHGHSRAR